MYYSKLPNCHDCSEYCWLFLNGLRFSTRNCWSYRWFFWCVETSSRSPTQMKVTSLPSCPQTTYALCHQMQALAIWSPDLMSIKVDSSFSTSSKDQIWTLSCSPPSNWYYFSPFHSADTLLDIRPIDLAFYWSPSEACPLPSMIVSGSWQIYSWSGHWSSRWSCRYAPIVVSNFPSSWFICWASLFCSHSGC